MAYPKQFSFNHLNQVVLSVVLLLVFTASCSSLKEETASSTTIPEIQEADTLRYLALGDSYTIGHSVAFQDRFPMQLADSLRANNFRMLTPQIIAVTGWTTTRLLEELAINPPAKDFDLVSLLIGVNNQYRNFDFEVYEEEFPNLLNKAIQYAGGDKNNVFVVSIPDYAFTPFGQSANNPQKISEELDAYNAYAKTLCEQEGIPFFNITPISREGLERAELVASDGLHPSGKMYQEWIQLFYQEVELLLQN